MAVIVADWPLFIASVADGRRKMQSKKLQLERTYKSAEKEAEALQQKLSNVEQYIGFDKMQSQEKSYESASKQNHPHKPLRS